MPPTTRPALAEFYGKYVWRHPVQADLDSLMSTVNESIYNYMQGPSEFTITGTLKRYDGTPLLKGVTVPTLFTVGEFDEADPPTIRRFAKMTPGAQVVVLPARRISRRGMPGKRASVRSEDSSVPRITNSGKP